MFGDLDAVQVGHENSFPGLMPCGHLPLLVRLVVVSIRLAEMSIGDVLSLNQLRSGKDSLTCSFDRKSGRV